MHNGQYTLNIQCRLTYIKYFNRDKKNISSENTEIIFQSFTMYAERISFFMSTKKQTNTNKYNNSQIYQQLSQPIIHNILVLVIRYSIISYMK